MIELSSEEKTVLSDIAGEHCQYLENFFHGKNVDFGPNSITMAEFLLDGNNLRSKLFIMDFQNENSIYSKKLKEKADSL